jgi:hypothetical protein
MYAMVHTRPDIAFTLRKLSQHIKDPTDFHIEAVKNLMQYIRSTIMHRIKYSKGVNPTLSLYLDADWARQLVDRKSTSGSTGILYNRVITWLSKV